MQDLYEMATAFLARALKDQRAARLVGLCDWEQVYQFEIGGERPFYWHYKDGKITCNPGSTDQSDFMIVTRIIADANTLQAVFMGKADSVNLQYKESKILFQPSSKYSQIHFFHQLACGNRNKVLEEVISDHDVTL